MLQDLLWKRGTRQLGNGLLTRDRDLQVWKALTSLKKTATDRDQILIGIWKDLWHAKILNSCSH